MACAFVHPFNCIIAGPSQSGKSQFVRRLIHDRLFSVKFKIHWFFTEWQPLYDELKGITFKEGLPDLKEYSGEEPFLLVLDDLMSQAGTKVANLFTKGTHHRNLSVIYITQNLFHQAKDARDISLNCHYLICMKSPRDAQQITFLARQVAPDNSKFVIESYRDATSRPHGYIVFDFKQSTPDQWRLRTNIFKGEECIAYVPK